MTTKPINLLPGYQFNYQNEIYVILDILNLEEILVKDIKTGRSKRINVKDIPPQKSLITSKRKGLLEVEDKDWNEARRKFEIIRPLLELEKGKRSQIRVKEIADANHVSAATLYRWLENYESTERLSSLLRAERVDKGRNRIQPEVEKKIKEVIQNSYLTEERPTPKDIWEEVKAECRLLNLPAPHPNTIRNRIASISDELKLEKRFGKKAAKEKFTPLKGNFPGADYPLAVYQIDHTPMDIILVSDDDRLPIGRPNLTCAIDVNSKVVPGYFIGLDPVGALSTGLCIAHAVLPKEAWLAKMDITTPYPIWGKPRVIHTDNAKEFRGNMIGKGCDEHGISLEHRPKGQPNYGGHIERSFRTYMQKLHTVKGTTRSNVQDKCDYDSDGRACMTLGALEKWFAIFITEYYHQKEHEGNDGIPPIVKFERGILGSDKQPGIGLPARIQDELKFKLDFMPYFLRTIQEYGVLFEDVHYYHDALRRWMHAKDPEKPKNKRKFIFRYDPRDLSQIHFFEPDTKTYISIPYADITKPAISLWELREAKRKLAAENYVHINESLVFGAVLKMREIVKSESDKTKRVRRLAARKKGWNKAKDHLANSSAQNAPLEDKFDQQYDIFSADISGFDDIKEAD